MQATEPAGRHAVPLMHDGIDRPYLLQVPPTADTAGARMPLVVEVHGRGIDAERFDRMTGFGALAAAEGFVLALPSAVGEIWYDGRDAAPAGRRPDDVGYVAAMIDDAIGRAPIDPRRIYVVGMSNGAHMAGRLACELAERIAAVAQVSGTAGVGIVANCRPACPVPIINIHGSADDVAPYEGGSRHSLRSRVMIRHAIGPSVGVDDWARFWTAANGALDGPALGTLPPDTTIRTWRGPTPSSDVAFYRIEGGGHTWPGSRLSLPALLFGRTSRTFDATRLSWEFLAGHTR